MFLCWFIIFINEEYLTFPYIASSCFPYGLQKVGNTLIPTAYSFLNKGVTLYLRWGFAKTEFSMWHLNQD